MGQWGRVAEYDGLIIIPHVNTGQNQFNPIGPGSFIDTIFVIEGESEDTRIHEEYAMKKKFVGMPYTEYLEITDWVCPTCHQPKRKRYGHDEPVSTL